MKIDNQRNTYRLWLQRLVLTIVFTILIIVIIFIPWFDDATFWLDKYHLIIAIAVIYIGINLHGYLKRPFFVFYSDQGEKIILRYYSLSLFNSRKNSIEIPKQQLVKYELKSFYFGTQKMLILHQLFRDKVAKYPPISISALDPGDQEKILNSLKKHTS
jgi:hypothetical protein